MTRPQGAEERATHFLSFHSRYLEAGCIGIGYFRHWIDELQREDSEGFVFLLRVARGALNSDEPLVRRSAMQALANIGAPEDVAAIERLSNDSVRDMPPFAPAKVPKRGSGAQIRPKDVTCAR